MYIDPIELVDTITGNWHSPPTHVLDATIIPPNDPEFWPHNLLTSLADLSILTAIDLDSSTGFEKFERARDRLTELCTDRQDQAGDSHGEQGAGIMQATDVEAVIAELGGRQNQANPTAAPSPTTVFPVARMSVAGGTALAATARHSDTRQVFDDEGQGEWEQQRPLDARHDHPFCDEASDQDGPPPSPSPSASRAITPEPPSLVPNDHREITPARHTRTPSSPAAPAPPRSTPRARLLRARKYRDLANELERLEFKATRMSCLEKARVVKRKMWRIEDEQDDEDDEDAAGRREKKKGRFE
ncbi:hypothetical protein BDU57DRAFT_76786 [Ampelomyces quisqualis]|uniref:Uncharacterized protein n=1 Tax=Ampelomyces quisqualis TaxID=50730 RepID=A0A6A5Q9C8_AMPQU|nr:hypothetical protein BDU57DRAFT_76786 [Ampelomyces quisqualis]